MDEPSRAEFTDERATWRARWAHASHRLIPPVAGGAALVAGSVMAAGVRSPLGEYAPAILLATGAAAVSATLVNLLARRSRASGPGDPRADAVEEAARLEELCRYCEGTGLSALEDPEDPASVGPIGSRRIVLSSSTTPGDQIWSGWLRTDGGHLPVGLIGPVPETAYMPPRAGQFIPFPEREPDLILTADLPSRRGSALREPPRPAPFPVEELDRLFPPDLPATDSSTAPVSGPLDVPDEIGSDPVFGTPPPPGSLEYQIHLEAITATPPHLRSAAPPRTESSTPAPRVPSRMSSMVARTECASCDRELVELRSWGPCPECLRPVCNLCLLESLWKHGRGYCGPCAGEVLNPAMDLPRGGAESADPVEGFTS
jgi:hypothetical protein